MPWIWDAIYDPTAGKVELFTIFRGSCAFDKELWLKIVSKYPQYKSNLANGNTENILVQTEPKKVHNMTLISGLHDDHVICNFHSNGKGNPIVAQTKSQSIPVSKYLHQARFIIECPAPDLSALAWDRMSIERSTTTLKGIPSIDISVNRTQLFSVCQLSRGQGLQIEERQRQHSQHPHYAQHSQPQVTSLLPPPQQYELSVCTATGRVSREQMVEWIEYNLLQGMRKVYSWR